MKFNTTINWIILATSLIMSLAAFVFFFDKIPTQNNTLAMDWKTFWPSLRNGNLQYLPLDGLRFPPWSILPILPLGFLSMQKAWGALACIGVFILTFSVPKTKSKVMFWISAILLITSFPSLRNIADGNMENLVVGGVLLIIYGYERKLPLITALGILISTIKLQEITILLIVLGWYLFQTWNHNEKLKMGLLVSGVVVFSLMWRGQAWIIALFGPNYQKYTGSIIDISLTAALKRLGFVPPTLILLIWIILWVITLFIAWRTSPSLSREKAGLLIAISLLLAPYAAGNSVLSVLAIGIIPLFQKRRLLGIGAIILVNLPFMFSSEILYNYQAYYWTTCVFLFWIILCWECLSKHQKRNVPYEETKDIYG
jgi:hypothetical protein